MTAATVAVIAHQLDGTQLWLCDVCTEQELRRRVIHVVQARAVDEAVDLFIARLKADEVPDLMRRSGRTRAVITVTPLEVTLEHKALEEGLDYTREYYP